MAETWIEAWVDFPNAAGNYATAPDADTLTPAGAFSIRCDWRLDPFNDAGAVPLGKGAGTGGEWGLDLDTQLLYIYVDGVWSAGWDLSGIFSDNQRWQARVDYNGTDTVEGFYRSTILDLEDNTGWTSTGTEALGSGGPANTTQTVSVGAYNNGANEFVQGPLYRAIYLDAGTKKVDFDPVRAVGWSPDRSTYTDVHGNVFTWFGSAWQLVVVKPELVVRHSDEFVRPKLADITRFNAELVSPYA